MAQVQSWTCICPIGRQSKLPSKALEYWLITGNIARLREQLKTEQDSAKRKILESILAAEKKKLGFAD